MRSPAHRRFIFVSRLAAMIALAGIVWLAASPGVERRDGRWLLLVNGVPVDVLGTADETWQRLTSDCSQIAEVSGDSAATAPLLTAIREFSPPIPCPRQSTVSTGLQTGGSSRRRLTICHLPGLCFTSHRRKTVIWRSGESGAGRRFLGALCLLPGRIFRRNFPMCRRHCCAAAN